MKRHQKHPQSKYAAKASGWTRVFAVIRSGNSKGWFLLTSLQCALTVALLGTAYLVRGSAWQGEVQVLVTLAIVATWCFALRAIRERILELFAHPGPRKTALLRRRIATPRRT